MPSTARTKSGQFGPSRKSDFDAGCLRLWFLSLAIWLSLYQGVDIILEADERLKFTAVVVAADARLFVHQDKPGAVRDHAARLVVIWSRRHAQVKSILYQAQYSISLTSQKVPTFSVGLMLRGIGRQ